MDVPVLAPFIEFDFGDMFYRMNGNYRPNLIEQWFEEGVAICNRPPVQVSDRGPALTIEPWVDRDGRSNERRATKDPYVLLQIVQMMPLRMNSFDYSQKVLHEMVVVAWSCVEVDCPFNPFKKRFKLHRRPEDQFFLVLNRWISWSVIHTCRRRHLGLVFTRELYLQLLANSNELGRKVREEVEWGLVVTLGRTIQEISNNLNEFHRARALLRRVFDLVSIAYMTINEEARIEGLQDVGMYFRDDLEGIKPPPMPTPPDDD